MKISLAVLSLVFVVAFSAAAQEQRRENIVDTTAHGVRTAASALMFEQPMQLLPLSMELAVTPDYFKRMAFQSTAGDPYFFSKHELGTMDLAMPWKLELARQNEHKLWYEVLGAIEAGGVAYLAYDHIKRYGWK